MKKILRSLGLAGLVALAATFLLNGAAVACDNPDKHKKEVKVEQPTEKVEKAEEEKKEEKKEEEKKEETKSE